MAEASLGEMKVDAAVRRVDNSGYQEYLGLGFGEPRQWRTFSLY
jgi:hypothetical protein